MIEAHIAGFRSSALGEFSGSMPWELTFDSIGIVERLLQGLREEYDVTGSVAIHRTSTVENGAVIKVQPSLGRIASSLRAPMFVVAVGWRPIAFLDPEAN